jgi:hypothetical protein
VVEVLFALLAVAFVVMLLLVIEGGKGSRTKALANRDQILAGMFGGDPVTVTFREWNGSLPAEVVIDEAHRRGYRVLTETSPTRNSRELTFGR